MIVFDLACENAHRFEGWFRSSADFAEQRAKGLLCCPNCGSDAIEKAPMAPAVPAKGNVASEPPRAEVKQTLAKGAMPPEVKQAFEKLVAAQAKALEKSQWVGKKFAEEARSMHYGEKDEAPIHGEATRREAESLVEEGIAVAPLLVPVAPPGELN